MRPKDIDAIVNEIGEALEKMTAIIDKQPTVDKAGGEWIGESEVVDEEELVINLAELKERVCKYCKNRSVEDVCANAFFNLIALERFARKISEEKLKNTELESEEYK